ncbi:phosphoesterase [Sulfolobus islandicus Y.G.57.14]|jgi:putative SbcD/Mre11-related phosphoesterase|uniref:ICC-like protein phosphoesterase n=11 Tax=Saccharolobus TaxID=2100760 RepID=A0A8F5BWR2_9CREN|nr:MULTISPECIES: metallophosphoesterase [Sulfolobaceae]ACP35369.1 phosphoesterase [Sulfolobus islandicus L.S.2.15]ACP38029.1 phosphoesterase [Sulfolobus islandicus M.14.25]ACP45525.1 phosphoesterase [Sulfolobus islandicus Y.G.57.14]ACP48677.1 phosphoesterase [Sulfolobus islandicus Y.N.15.51]ACR41862.1 phosphoesterase [Sulfolobus islandicus M.16.4]
MLELTKGILIAEDLPALYVKHANSVVMSDVHIGYEEEMSRKGIYIPRIQKKRFLSITNRVFSVFNTKKLIVNGDFKHTFEKLTRQEKEELNEILKYLKDNGVEVIIVRGNHDNYISLVTEKFDNVRLVDELDLGEILITHGHKVIEPRNNTTYIIGHEHPRLSIRDKLGFSRKLQCFLSIPIKERENSQIIVLPAIGIYQAGNDISLIHSNYMSNLIKEHAILEKAKPYVIIEGEGIMEFPELGLIKNILI